MRLKKYLTEAYRMRLKQYITESAESDLAQNIANVIYGFTENIGRDADGYKVCHDSVNYVKMKGKDLMVGRYAFYKELQFFIWDERKWKPLENYIKQDTTWKRIKIKPFQNLVTDIAGLDGMPSVNGHSFLKYKKFYIDPYMDSARVDFKGIQRIGKWFEKALKSI